MATKVTNGLDLQNQRVLNLGPPSNDSDAANKSYVDSVARGLDWKQSVRAASTGNVSLSSPGASMDGVTLAAQDRVLLKNQTAGAENGIYAWTGAAAALVRATDADTNAEVSPGMAVTVTEGAANGDKVFVLTTDTINLGTTALAFSQLGGGGGAYIAGNGLAESPAGTFNVGAGTGIVVNANDVAIDSNVVPRKFATNVGGSTTVTVTHNFGTRDVHVSVFTNSTPWDDVICDVTRPDVNSVTLGFAASPATGAYRVVVTG